MCTSLIYRDAAGRPYFGRTLELTVELPYQVAYVPPGTPFSSASVGHPALGYRACHAFVAVTVPDRVPAADAPVAFADLKVLEGLNDQGLTFSLLSYPAASGKQKAVDLTRAVLSASDLGSWALGQFATVAEVKTALAEQPVMLEALAMLGGVESPFHYVVHDATGAALVIEFDHGAMTLHDNPVGVMTNGPAFGWHLTNLDNYTFLSNVDRSRATFGTYTATQPDSGIATAGLPASNTSVGRFVRAAYYAQFTEAAATPDLAVTTLAHIIAEELGVSKTTVHRWVHQGEELAAQADYLNVIRGRRAGISIMDAVQEWMLDLRDNPDISIDQEIAAAAVVIKAEERRDRLGGFEAPRRVAVADDRERAPVTVPGHVLDAVNRYVAGEDPYDDDEEGRR